MQQKTASPLVSVVVISHNYEAFVAEAVRSAIGQSYPAIEVIVVDDGSTDRSREVLARFANRIAVIGKPNEGETSAVNLGFAASRGDIVMFLDSDDRLGEAAVAEVVGAWRPGTAKVQFPLAVIDGEGRPLGRRVLPVFPPGISPADVRRRVLRHGFYPWPPTTGNAYARHFLEQVMPLDAARFPFAPDGILNTIAPLYGEVRTIEKLLGFYRIHGRNKFASLTLDPKRMLAYIAQGRKEAAVLREHAERCSVRLADVDPLDHSFIFLERRLAAARLTPSDPLMASDRSLALFWRACGCIGTCERRRTRQLLRLGWFLLTAIAPRPLAHWLLRLRFTESSHPPLVRRLIRFAR
jgi:glycosyltransferase involved in cell wall biosynthesis